MVPGFPKPLKWKPGTKIVFTKTENVVCDSSLFPLHLCFAVIHKLAQIWCLVSFEPQNV